MASIRVTKRSAALVAREVDWKRLDSMTAEELEAAALSDTDNPPLSAPALRRLATAAMIRRIRKSVGLTQLGFARRYKVPVATLRDWEQGRRAPESAVLAYLTVIDRIPREVQAALAPMKSRRQRRVTA